MTNHSCCTRRHVLAIGAAATLLPMPTVSASDFPREVAGVEIPRSTVTVKAAAYARASYPDFLFNHCMRTFLFGALMMKKNSISYNADEAFTAAVLHDLGLLIAFESAQGSFEVDGADAAEKFALSQGLAQTDADRIWHAVVFHDGRWAITRRAGAEAMLVSAGAGADVVGPGDDFDARQVVEIVGAFPRLQFKKKFIQIAIDHCKRKPQSQRGTWLEGLCREQVPSAFADTTERQISTAPFVE